MLGVDVGVDLGADLRVRVEPAPVHGQVLLQLERDQALRRRDLDVVVDLLRHLASCTTLLVATEESVPLLDRARKLS